MPKVSGDLNLKFVELYHEEECLWNASIPSYKNKSMRDTSLQKICESLTAETGQVHFYQF
jgi:hypothetical protein